MTKMQTSCDQPSHEFDHLSQHGAVRRKWLADERAHTYSSVIGSRRPATNWINAMTFTAPNGFNTSAFTIAATAFVVLHGSLLIGFANLASNVPNTVGVGVGTDVAKTQTAPRNVTLETVVISSRRA